jgi:hypothetical protein
VRLSYYAVKSSYYNVGLNHCGLGTHYYAVRLSCYGA